MSVLPATEEKLPQSSIGRRNIRRMIAPPQDETLKLSKVCCFVPAVKVGQCLCSLFIGLNIIGNKINYEVYSVSKLKLT